MEEQIKKMSVPTSDFCAQRYQELLSQALQLLNDFLDHRVEQVPQWMDNARNFVNHATQYQRELEEHKCRPEYWQDVQRDILPAIETVITDTEQNVLYDEGLILRRQHLQNLAKQGASEQFQMLNEENENNQNPTLVLNFDLNGTLLATDEAGGKSEECMLSSLIAKRTRGNWTNLSDSKENEDHYITYYEYLKSIEPTGNLSATEKSMLKKQRTQKLCDFVQDYDAQFGGQMLPDLQAMTASLASQRTMVFNSFFRLLEFLNQSDRPYHIVLRTFGTDLPTVVPALEHELGVAFIRAEFENDALKIFDSSGDILITDYVEIERILNETPYLAVRDDFPPWNAHREDWHYGKKFFIPSNANTLGLFFDDNIEPGQSNTNIVQPIKVIDSGTIEQIDPAALFDTQLFRVDTESAIIDPNYFVHLVQKALDSF